MKVRTEERARRPGVVQETALTATWVSVAVFGLSGVPAGLAVLVRRWRRPLPLIAFSSAGFGLAGTLLSVLVYFVAFHS